MCSIYPAARYIVSQTELLITGTVTSCRTLGRGPSIYEKEVDFILKIKLFKKINIYI